MITIALQKPVLLKPPNRPFRRMSVIHHSSASFSNSAKSLLDFRAKYSYKIPRNIVSADTTCFPKLLDFGTESDYAEYIGYELFQRYKKSKRF